MISHPDTAMRFDSIYDSTNREVLAFITAKCGRTADINDIFQETYMDLYSLLERRGVNYVTHEKALVMRIAKRKISKHYSLVDRLKVFASLTGADEEDADTDLTESIADDFSVEEFVINDILLENARKLIKTKPENVRKVFYLMYNVGLTIPEIAQKLSMSESNVKNKLYRTITELRNTLNS